MVEAPPVSYAKAAEKGKEAEVAKQAEEKKNRAEEKARAERKTRGARRKKNVTARGRNARSLIGEGERRRNARRVTGTTMTTSVEETADVMKDGTANEENDERIEERIRRGKKGVIASVSAIAIVTALLVIAPLTAITMRNLTLAPMMRMAGLLFAGSLKAGLISFILF